MKSLKRDINLQSFQLLPSLYQNSLQKQIFIASCLLDNITATSNPAFGNICVGVPEPELVFNFKQLDMGQVLKITTQANIL